MLRRAFLELGLFGVQDHALLDFARPCLDNEPDFVQDRLLSF